MRLAGTTMGRYYPGESIFHRADPRVKIAVSFAYVVALFLVGGFTGLALLAAALAAGIAAAGVPVRWIYRTVRPLLWLLIFTFLFQVLLTGGEQLARLGPLAIHRQGIYGGGFLAARLVLLALSGALLTFTTPPVLLADALGSLLSPLRRVRLPVYELALIVTIALRFIPTLLMELDRIIMAQRARGAGARGGPIRRARGLMPVLVPLFAVSFRHADRLADAMESRCWRGGRGRTIRRRLRLRGADARFLIVSAAVLAASLWLGRFW